MNKVISTKYQETYYEETLDNGLKVVVWHKPNYEKSFALMATPLGGFDISQIDQYGNSKEYPSGLAHFLEHKMFEKENEDVMEEFSRMGANVNAATSYDNTCYFFQTSDEIEEPLNLLLDFTQDIDINEESVEKEKGIIVQELNMYAQMSDFRLVRETFTSLYQNHPLKFDVGGTTDDVVNTSLDDLLNCFKYNYHPSTMVCIVVTGKDPNLIFEIIRENQKNKTFDKIELMKRNSIEEPKEVVLKNKSFEMDVNKPKVNVALKFEGIKDSKDRVLVDAGLRFILDYLFTPVNPEYQDWLDQNIINDFFGYDYDFGYDYGYLMIYSETSKKDEFVQLVFNKINSLKDIVFDNEIFKQLKRRYYGENIRELNDFENIAFNYVRFYFNDIDYLSVYDCIESMKIEDLQKVLSFLCFDQYSIIECNPMKKSD